MAQGLYCCFVKWVFFQSDVTKAKITLVFICIYFSLKETRVLSLILVRRVLDIFFSFVFFQVILDYFLEIHVTEKLKVMFTVTGVNLRPCIG